MEEQTIENIHWVVRAFNEGGPVMYVIAFFGLMTIMLIIERVLKLRNLTVSKSALNTNVYSMILRGDIKQAITYCDRKPAPLTNTLKAGMVSLLNRRPDEEIQVAMDATVLKESPRFEGWSGFLAVFGNVALLSGLLGTIIGMITSFRAVAAVDPVQKAEELSKGISHALNCTAFGLLVAIIAIVAYGWFQVRISRAENDLHESSMSLMNLIASNRDKLKS